jgi:hypothetical protein
MYKSLKQAELEAFPPNRSARRCFSKIFTVMWALGEGRVPMVRNFLQVQDPLDWGEYLRSRQNFVKMRKKYLYLRHEDHSNSMFDRSSKLNDHILQNFFQKKKKKIRLRYEISYEIANFGLKMLNMLTYTRLNQMQRLHEHTEVLEFVRYNEVSTTEVYLQDIKN